MLFSIISPHGASLFSNTSGHPLFSQLPGYLQRPMLILHRQGRLEVKDPTEPVIFSFLPTWNSHGMKEPLSLWANWNLFAFTHEPEEKSLANSIYSVCFWCVTTFELIWFYTSKSFIKNLMKTKHWGNQMMDNLWIEAFLSLGNWIVDSLRLLLFMAVFYVDKSVLLFRGQRFACLKFPTVGHCDVI